MGGQNYTDETLKKQFDLAEDLGVDVASEQLGIKRETLRRNIREYKQRNAESGTPFDDRLIKQLQERFAPDELRRLLTSSHFTNKGNNAKHSFDGDTVTFGVISDTHLGSIYTDVAMVDSAFEECAERGAEFVVMPGDIFEGLSHRPGHCYECSHLGYSAQLNHGREVLGRWSDIPIYMIDGNHDRWYIKSNGAVICEELARSLDHVTFLGHDEGDIDCSGVAIKTWHGEDGSSYAFSYRIQKLVESFTGGEKPQVLIAGHTHKAFYVFDRNIHCLSAAALQKQSKWMRSKRQQSHTGFWIVEMTVNNGDVQRFKPEFYPFYR